MIAHLSGQLAGKTENALIIDVGGVGYEVFVAAGDHQAANIGSAIKLHTYYHVRETAHELFGFSEPGAKRLFELLISVSGVGPKMALSLLNLAEADTIRSAIARADSAFLQKASGVGKRLAERITVDLKDKAGLPNTLPVAGFPNRLEGGKDDALEALIALGYSLAQASEALGKIDAGLPVEVRLKEALKLL